MEKNLIPFHSASKLVYLAYFPSIGLKSYLLEKFHGQNLFTNSKKIIRLIQHIKKRVSLLQCFRTSLPADIYVILSLLTTWKHFAKRDIHMTTILQVLNLSSYQKGVYYAGTKLYNALPPNNKIINHTDIFKPALKACTLTHRF